MTSLDDIERMWEEANAGHVRSDNPGQATCPYCGQEWPADVREGEEVFCTCGRTVTA